MEIEKLKGYLAEGLSLVKIGKMEGKSLGSIRYWMGVHGLKPNFKNFKEEPYHKKSVVEGKKHCTRCKEWKEIGAFSTKGENRYQNYCKVCHAEYTLERWKNRKKKIIEMMGGKCIKCGYCRNYSALEFHHVDPSKKEVDIAKSIRMSWKSLIKELKKCILICANCHREEHNPEMVLFGDVVESNPSLNWELKPTGTCPHCETKVFGTKYCSQICAKSAKRRAERPNKEELELLIKTTPMLQIGKMYGVSDNAIRKWAEFYGIEHKKN